MPSWKDMCEAAELRKSWDKTCLQLMYDIGKEIADVTGCNIPTDFMFYFPSRSLASKVVVPADVTFLIHFVSLFCT